MSVNAFKSGVWSVNDVYEKIKLNEWKFYDPDAPGQFWIWGYNSGVFGINSTVPNSSATPIRVPGDNWKIVNLSSNALALKGDGTMWAWGYGRDGINGTNSTLCTSSPAQIPGTAWCSIGLTTRAVKTNNTLWAWGYNRFGALGTGNQIHRSSPTQIPGTQWCAGEFNHALKTDGTLWGWGVNCSYGTPGAGIIGDSTTISRSSPVQIPGTQWVSIGPFSTALKSDGTLWRWGTAGGGALGNDTITPTNSPVQVPGTWIFSSGTKALKSDGTLWSWGGNTSGQVGDGTFTNRSSPVQIPGSWFRVNQGPQALKTDGTLWAWAGNSGGRLGIGCTDICFCATTPVQVDGLWKNIPSSAYRGAIRSE